MTTIQNFSAARQLLEQLAFSLAERYVAENPGDNRSRAFQDARLRLACLREELKWETAA